MMCLRVESVKKVSEARVTETQIVTGQSGTITAVVNVLAKAGIELGENGSVIPGLGKPAAFGWMGRCPAAPFTVP